MEVHCHLPARALPSACTRIAITVDDRNRAKSDVTDDFARSCGLVLVKRRRFIAFIHIIQFFMDFHLGYRFLCARTNKGRNFFPAYILPLSDMKSLSRYVVEFRALRALRENGQEVLRFYGDVYDR